MGVKSELAAPDADRVIASPVGLPYWRCAAALCASWVTLRVAGFAQTLCIVRSTAEGRPAIPTRMDAVRRAAERVATVAAFFPGRALCLEQSLTLYWLLRRRGVPVQFRMGVHPAPFIAHAWIEYEGVPINEDVDRIQELLPLPLDDMEAL